MQLDRVKSIARRVVELLGEDRFDELIDLLHEDATWSFPFRRENFPYSGTWGKSELRAVAEGFHDSFAGFRITVRTVIAEGDHAAIEAIGKGTGKNGARYDQIYHFAIELDGDKVKHVREYFDPIEVMNYIGSLDVADRDAFDRA